MGRTPKSVCTKSASASDGIGIAASCTGANAHGAAKGYEGAATGSSSGAISSKRPGKQLPSCMIGKSLQKGFQSSMAAHAREALILDYEIYPAPFLKKHLTACSWSAPPSTKRSRIGNAGERRKRLMSDHCTASKNSQLLRCYQIALMCFQGKLSVEEHIRAPSDYRFVRRNIPWPGQMADVLYLREAL